MVRHTTTYVFSLFFMLISCQLYGKAMDHPDTLLANQYNQKLENVAPESEIIVKDLKPGQTYSVLFVANDEKTCIPIISMNQKFETYRETGSQIIMEFRASQTTQSIHLKSPCPDVLQSNFFIETHCESCPYEESAERNLAAISAVSGTSPEELVLDNFVAGGCYDVENITFKGPDIARGLFSKGQESISMDEGIILATGDVKDCKGPNESSKTSTKFQGAAEGDPDLRQLLIRIGSKIRTVKDVAILEFDFTPTQDKVSFEYVFASDEYCDFVGSGFNDVFGFFISGPGINGPFSNGGENIAKLPNSNTYVSINTINWGENKQYYNNNRPLFQAQQSNGCTWGEAFGTAVAKNTLEYDGFTNVLTATANVIPCETYHIKLAVGDVADDGYDSAVFFKKNSFKLGDPAELTTEIPNATFPDSNLVYESCQESFFVFKRTEDSDITRPQQVPFSISDLSTATPNVDYSTIRSPVIIPAGKDSIKVPVTVFQDAEIEGPETIIFELESACTCEGLLTELVITEPEEPSVTINELSTCPGGMVNIIPNIEGGAGDFSYEWSTNETDESISATIEAPTTISVTVTDQCGSEATASVDVKTDDQVATLTGQVVVCNGAADGAIEVNFTGSGPYSLAYEFNGEPKNISGIPNANFILPVAEEGTYEAIGMTSNGCTGTGEGTGEIIVTNVQIENKLASPKCNRSQDGFIEITMDEDEGVYTYNWDNGTDDKRIENLVEGDYAVTVTNQLGCADTKLFTLTKPDRLAAKIEPSGIANCYNSTGGSIKLDVEGGTAGYVFDWNNGMESSQNLDDLGAGTYKVEVTDFNGCTTTAVAEIEDDQIIPTIILQEHGILSCRNDQLAITANGSSTGTDFEYYWTTDDGNIVSQFTPLKVTIDGEGTYKLEIINLENGCSNEISTFVKENREIPKIELAEPTTLNCKNESQLIVGTILEDMVDYDLDWSTDNGNFISDTDILSPEIDGAGTYKVNVTNNINGCSIEKSVTIFEDKAKPKVSFIEPLSLTCIRNAVSIKTEIEDMSKDYEVSWETIEGNFLENRNTLTPSVDKPGLYTLKVRDADNFCQTEVQTNVMIDTLSPKVEAGQTRIFNCDVSRLNLRGSVVDNRAYEFNWTTENGNIIEGANTLNPAIDIAGEYQLFVKDEVNGCESRDMVLITDDTNRPNAAVAPPDAITCVSNSVILDASVSTQGPTINYRWEELDGTILDDTNPINPVVGAAGKYMLFVVDQSNGCEGKKIVEVPLDTVAPTALITAPEVFNCSSETVEIDGSLSSTGPNFAFNWSTTDGNIRSNSNAVSPIIDQPGTYQLDLLNTDNGCLSTTSLVVISEMPTALELAVDQPLCFGEQGQASIVNVVGGVGPYTYSIDGGNRFIKDAGFGYLDAGFYNLVVKDVNDCEIEEVIQIVQPEKLAVDLGLQLDIKLGDSTELQALTNIPASEVAEVIWSPSNGLSCDDCLNPTAKPFQSIDYKVEIIDQNGCSANSELRLLVDQTPQIFAPNVFAPFDSQAGNDRFTIFAKGGMVNQIVSLEIYNRWGETVYINKNFSPNDPSKGWDGFFDNQRMKPAVFVYRAEIEMVDGRTVQLSGDFALVK